MAKLVITLMITMHDSIFNINGTFPVDTENHFQDYPSSDVTDIYPLNSSALYRPGIVINSKICIC